MFINSIALWEMEKYLSDIEMEEAYALCIKTKGSNHNTGRLP